MMSESVVTVNGARLWMVREGSGFPSIWCSGGPGCCDYLGQVTAMVDDLVQVVRFDARGCGRSEVKRPYTLPTAVADLDGIRQHLGCDEWIVAGHSWGALLALAYAVEHPTRMKGLIYMSGTGITLDYREPYHRSKSTIGELEPEYDYPHNLQVNKEMIVSDRQWMADPELPARIRKLTVPTLIIQGEQDIRTEVGARKLAALMPSAQFELVSGAAHYLWLAHAEQVRDLLRSWLSHHLKVSPKS
jgi:proline iminopeptidase